MTDKEATGEFLANTDRRYNDLASYFRRRFGRRIQKLSVNGGFTCPNRDGTKGRGGCSYCNNDSFHPSYCVPDESITSQLDKGIAFFEQKYPGQNYLAYFQSYTNTYAPVAQLALLYEEALSHPRIDGLVIGTRPDCVNDELLNYLELLAQQWYVVVEYGVESTLDRTLLAVNRGHTWQQSVEAIKATAERGILTGAHMIIGLPGESEDDFFHHIDQMNQLPLALVKFHQMQVVRGTSLAQEYKTNPAVIRAFGLDEYLDLVIRLIEKLRPDMIIERFVSESSPDLLITPRWGLKNFEIVERLVSEMKKRNTWQGRLFGA